MFRHKLIILATIALAPLQVAAESTLKIYHDADWSHHVQSAESMWRGIQTALSEVDHTIQGHKIELVKKDHRGNVVRSLRNYRDFLADPDGLVIFSGIHSPPLIRNRNFINHQKALTLVPWAAAGPITRFPSGENWIYRLSVDDTKAGEFLIDYAVKYQRCQAPFLLLEDTPWGDSNLKNMGKALDERGLKASGLIRFRWGLKQHTAREIMRKVKQDNADCIMLVATAVEGAILVEAAINTINGQETPIISHWGITGGDFHEKIDATKRKKINLSFIQSCFSFLSSKQSPFAKSVLNRAKKLFPDEIHSPQDIHAPTGFIHAYDLTRILIRALNAVELSGDPIVDRQAIKEQLENLNDPIEGLVKTYVRPFRQFSSTDTDAHEALSTRDFCMGQYGDNDEILLMDDH